MTVMSQLSTLESAGLIRLAQFEPDLEYLFRHTLVQDAAYATLLTSDRKRLHQEVGEAIEHLYPERLNEYAAMLARHFEQAGNDQHALEYFSRAGDAALASYANQEAESQYRSALALVCTAPQRAPLLFGLGEALYRQSRFDDAIQTWREGIELYYTLGDMDGVARLYARSARAAWYGGDQPKGLGLCQEGLDTVAGAPESPDLARLLHEAGRAYYFNGLPDKALPLCEQALEMAERLGAVDVQADTLATLGAFARLPNDESAAILTKAAELAESVGLLEVAARAHHNLAGAKKAMEGEQKAAREHMLRAAELGRQRGAASEELLSRTAAAGMSLGMGELAAVESVLPELERLQRALPDPTSAQHDIGDLKAVLLEFQGRWAESLQLWRDSCADARRRGDLQRLANAATNLAEALLMCDRLAELEYEDVPEGVLAEAEVVMLEAVQVGDRGLGTDAWARCHLAMVYARQGRFQDARDLLAEAAETRDDGAAVWNELAQAQAQGMLAVAEGRWSDALSAFETAADLCTRLDLRGMWARTLWDWAEVHAARGEPQDLERAETLLRKARAICEEMGSPYYAGLVEKRLQALRTEAYAQTLALGKVAQELAVAGRIQEGLLPRETPYIPGWQLAATLEPARETSGDFYDFIPLPNQCLGIVVADVSDKGAGAALYMALSRTLLRTYAVEYPSQPELALAAINARILADTHTDMFVTLFYGILDPHSGTLTYCNAGHNPPYLLSAEGLQRLHKPGLPLGILEDTSWELGTAQITPGDALILYTDGVTDAQKQDGTMFGEERLLQVLRACRGCSAQEMESALLSEIHGFVGDAPRFDDLTLMVIARA
jgi:serine phosphatase RsbU (regulator of sigma subunit)